MNVYDSQRMAELLQPLGYETSESAENADMVILNTCHIREKATDKVYSELGTLKRFKEARDGNMIIAVAGCVAQAEGDEILERAPYVDMVFGPQTYHRLPEMIAQATRVSEQKDQPKAPGLGILDVEFPAEDKFDSLPANANSDGGAAAFLTIQEGCDKFCHFCCVPYTRGAEYSRSVDTIAEEAKRLVDNGVMEITLLGQNVNAYHGEAPNGSGEYGLGQLLEHLAGIPEIKRLRYTTSHPRDVDDALIAAHRDIPEVMPYLHLPVQSGSDRILKAMNRKHTSEEYLKIIEQFRAARPDMGFSSDFIVGYPGETEEDFQATMDLVRAVEYGQCYSFKYSPRPGTPAAALVEQVEDAVKTDRLARLQELLQSQQVAFNKSMIGRKMDVLFEKPGRHEGQIVGRSPFMQSVYVQGSQRLIGQMAEVEIKGATLNSLQAELVLQESVLLVA